MKYKGQGKKEYVLVKFDDYENKKRVFTAPLTINQASWMVLDRPFQKYEIVRIKDLNALGLDTTKQELQND